MPAVLIEQNPYNHFEQSPQKLSHRDIARISDPYPVELVKDHGEMKGRLVAPPSKSSKKVKPDVMDDGRRKIQDIINELAGTQYSDWHNVRDEFDDNPFESTYDGARAYSKLPILKKNKTLERAHTDHRDLGHAATAVDMSKLQKKVEKNQISQTKRDSHVSHDNLTSMPTLQAIYGK